MILFFGPAGSGKSTQGQMLAKTLGWSWISSGDLLRQSQDPDVKSALAAGNLVPLEKFGQVFADAVKQQDKEHIILDGFPRQEEQAEWLQKNSDELGRKIQIAIVLDISEEVLIARMKRRGRADDTEEAIKKRLGIYWNEINPILAYLEEQHIPIAHVDGVGDVDQVQDRIMDQINTYKVA